MSLQSHSVSLKWFGVYSVYLKGLTFSQSQGEFLRRKQMG